MNLKECLVQLCDIRLEIKELEKKINKLEPKSKEMISDSVESTTKTYPIIRTHYKIFGNDQKYVTRLEKYKAILEQKRLELIDIEINTTNFINTIPTSRLRRIFIYRYIENYSWVKIACLIGNNATEDSVRKEHDRYLAKNNICPICP